MGERFWFAGRLTEEYKTSYLFSAPTKRFAMDVMLQYAKSPVIEQLTWARLQKLTGCIIPSASTPNDFAVGHCIIHRKENNDLILLPV